MRREVDFILRIETVENMTMINEFVNDICSNMHDVVKKVLVKRKLDAIIKKVKLNRITNM